MGELAPVTVLHRRQHPARRGVHIELNLGDARELPTDLVSIRRGRRAELVVVDLLKEIHVGGRSLASAWIARVEKACTFR